MSAICLGLNVLIYDIYGSVYSGGKGTMDYAQTGCISIGIQWFDFLVYS